MEIHATVMMNVQVDYATAAVVAASPIVFLIPPPVALIQACAGPMVYVISTVEMTLIVVLMSALLVILGVTRVILILLRSVGILMVMVVLSGVLIL